MMLFLLKTALYTSPVDSLFGKLQKRPSPASGIFGRKEIEVGFLKIVSQAFEWCRMGDDRKFMEKWLEQPLEGIWDSIR